MTKINRYRPGVWYQTGGDVDPCTYGGTICRDDGDTVDVIHIQPVREYAGDREAADVGYPLWSREACYDNNNLIAFLRDDSYRRCYDLDNAGELFDPDNVTWTRARRLVVAGVACESGWRCDEGPSGWTDDVVPPRVSWWSRGCTLRDWRAADADFRREILTDRD